tara:strand:- start:41806 stop:42027 length:222 start_codon:yes stop_codon:yes gene_type:complete
MRDTYIPPINTIRLNPVNKISPYAPIKKQRHKHYPGEMTKVLLDSITAKETFTYQNQNKRCDKIAGKIIDKKT